MSLLDGAYSGQNCSLRTGDADEQLNTFSAILDGPITLGIIIFGVLLNGYVIRRRMCNTPMWHNAFNLTTVFLLGWDTALMIISFWYYSLEANMAMTAHLLNSTHVQLNLTAVLHPFASIAFMCSAWFPVLMMTQSYHALVYPFRNMQWLQRRQMDTTLPSSSQRFDSTERTSERTSDRRRRQHRNIHGCRQRLASLAPAGSVNFVAVLVSLPTFYELTSSFCLDKNTGAYDTQIGPTVLRVSDWYIATYRIFRQMAVNMGPFLAMLLLRIYTEQALRKYSSERETLIELRFHGTITRVRERASAEARNWILRLFTAKFLLLRFLSAAVDVVELIQSPKRLTIVKYLASGSNLMVLLNCATSGALLFLTKKPLKRLFVKKILRQERIKAERLRQQHMSAEERLKHDPLVGAEGFFIVQYVTSAPPTVRSNIRRKYTEL